MMIQSLRRLGSEPLKLLTVVTGGHFAIHWFQQLFPVMLPSVKAGLGLSNVQIGALTSARQLVHGTLDFPSGMLADSMARFRSHILVSALVSMGAGYLLLGSMPVFYWALLGAGLIGLGTALWHPAAAASLSNTFPERRATALAIHGMGATTSDTLTPLGAGLLLLTFPWENVLQFQMIPAIFLALLVWLGLAGLHRDAEHQKWRSAQFLEIAHLAKNPAFLGVTVARGFMQMGRLVILTFLPIYLQEHLGYTPWGLGVYMALLHAMGTISQPVLGYLSDRFGRKAVLCPSYLMLGVLYALLILAEPGVALGLVIGTIGLFFYTLMNISNAAVMDVAGSKIQASSYGLTSLLSQVIVFPTPILAGFLIGRYGINSAFVLAATFSLLAGVMIAPLRLYRGTTH